MLSKNLKCIEKIYICLFRFGYRKCLFPKRWFIWKLSEMINFPIENVQDIIGTKKLKYDITNPRVWTNKSFSKSEFTIPPPIFQIRPKNAHTKMHTPNFQFLAKHNCPPHPIYPSPFTEFSSKKKIAHLSANFRPRSPQPVEKFICAWIIHEGKKIRAYRCHAIPSETVTDADCLPTKFPARRSLKKEHFQALRDWGEKLSCGRSK